MMRYSAINTKMAVPSSGKKKTAATEDAEPLPFADDDAPAYGEDETY